MEPGETPSYTRLQNMFNIHEYAKHFESIRHGYGFSIYFDSVLYQPQIENKWKQKLICLDRTEVNLNGYAYAGSDNRRKIDWPNCMKSKQLRPNYSTEHK